MKLNRTGFSVIEMVIAVTMVSAVVSIAVPRIRTAVVRESVRGARQAVSAQLGQARGVAAHRACASTIHFTDGATAASWVTSCNGAAIDTVSMTQLTDRFGVTVAGSVDSIVYNPNGLAQSTGWSTLTFTRGDISDTLRISPMGRALL